MPESETLSTTSDYYYLLDIDDYSDSDDIWQLGGDKGEGSFPEQKNLTFLCVRSRGVDPRINVEFSDSRFTLKYSEDSSLSELRGHVDDFLENFAPGAKLGLLCIGGPEGHGSGGSAGGLSKQFWENFVKQIANHSDDRFIGALIDSCHGGHSAPIILKAVEESGLVMGFFGADEGGSHLDYLCQGRNRVVDTIHPDNTLLSSAFLAEKGDGLTTTGQPAVHYFMLEHKDWATMQNQYLKHSVDLEKTGLESIWNTDSYELFTPFGEIWPVPGKYIRKDVYAILSNLYVVKMITTSLRDKHMLFKSKYGPHYTYTELESSQFFEMLALYLNSVIPTNTTSQDQKKEERYS